MEMVDLAEDREDLYMCCLKPYDEEFSGGVPLKRQWFARARERGLRVKLAIDDDGEVAGMIQYIPVEHSAVMGEDLYYIMCIWVHGYERGVGDRRGHGLGTALLEAAEEDARALGARGMVAWGIKQPTWMSAQWFGKHGYRRVDRDGNAVLVFKPFTEEALLPFWVKRIRLPGPIPGKVRVSSFVPGWCTSGNLIHEWARRAAGELGDPVVFEHFDTSDPGVLATWGVSSGLFVDGEELPIRGDETYEKVRTFIRERVPRGPTGR